MPRLGSRVRIPSPAPNFLLSFSGLAYDRWPHRPFRLSPVRSPGGNHERYFCAPVRRPHAAALAAENRPPSARRFAASGRGLQQEDNGAPACVARPLLPASARPTPRRTTRRSPRVVGGDELREGRLTRGACSAGSPDAARQGRRGDCPAIAPHMGPLPENIARICRRRGGAGLPVEARSFGAATRARPERRRVSRPRLPARPPEQARAHRGGFIARMVTKLR